MPDIKIVSLQDIWRFKMKKLFDDDFSIEEIKNNLRKMNKASNEKSNCFITALVIISIVAVVAAVIVAIVKLTKKDEFDELFDEDYDDYYATDEDFEE